MTRASEAERRQLTVLFCDLVGSTELRSLAIEQRFPIWLAGADIMRGYALTARGQAAEGLGLARKGLAVRKAT